MVDLAGNEKSFCMDDVENPTWKYIFDQLRDEYYMSVRIFDEQGREIEENSAIPLMNGRGKEEVEAMLIEELKEFFGEDAVDVFFREEAGEMQQ